MPNNVPLIGSFELVWTQHRTSGAEHCLIVAFFLSVRSPASSVTHRVNHIGLVCAVEFLSVANWNPESQR